MQAAARIAVSAFILSAVCASAYHSNTKLRRAGIVSLYPFPRVGRSGYNTWQGPVPRDLDHQPIQRRQLYAFPRVGRSDLSFLHANLDGDTLDLLLANHPKMWFGPRLGRSSKTDDGMAKRNEQEDPVLNNNEAK